MTQPKKYARCIDKAKEKAIVNGEGVVVVKQVADIERKNACRYSRDEWYR
jgi:hypothetical protein